MNTADSGGCSIANAEHTSSGGCITNSNNPPHHNFQEWIRLSNNGRKTTLKQQLHLAGTLYEQAYSSETTGDATAVEQTIVDLQSTPIDNTDTLVTWQGMHLGWFLNVFCESPYLKRLREFGCELWFIRKVCIVEMIRRTAGGSSGIDSPVSGPFVNHAETVLSEWSLPGVQYNNKAVVARSTRFISYTGAYTLEHIVDVLHQLPEDDYVWMDIFCVDQFAWTGRGRSEQMTRFRETLTDDLQHQIQAIPKTALVLEHWDNVMATLGQIWVLWEMFNACQADADLQILLPQAQADRFVEEILEREGRWHFDTVLGSLATIDANASVSEDDLDRRIIFQRMQQIGLSKVNATVVALMRDWLACEGLKRIEQRRVEGKEDLLLTLLNSVGVLLLSQGSLDEAEALLREGLEESQQRLGPEHEKTLAVFSNLAELFREQGRIAETEPLRREVLKACRKSLGDHHPDTIMAMNNLGTLLRGQGQLTEAKPLLQVALKYYRQLLGTNALTLTVANNLALLYRDEENCAQAEALFCEALEMSQTLLGNLHPTTLNIQCNLGRLYGDQDEQLDEAEALLSSAVAGYQQQLGEHHAHTQKAKASLQLLRQRRQMGGAEQVQTLTFEVIKQYRRIAEPEPAASPELEFKATQVQNIARHLLAAGNYAEAERLFRMVLELNRQLYSDQHHPNTLAAMNDLACALYRRDKLAEAEPLFRETLTARQEALGVDHQATVNTMNNLAALLEDQGKVIEAEVLHRESLTRCRQKLGNGHTVTLACIGNLATLLHNQGQYEAAERLFRESVACMQQHVGDFHPDTLTAVNNLATVLQSQRKYSEAAPLLRQTLEAKRRLLGDQHPSTLNSMNNLATLLTKNKEHDDAAALLQEALRGYSLQLGPHHTTTLTCARNLTELLVAQGKGGEADELLQRLGM